VSGKVIWIGHAILSDIGSCGVLRVWPPIIAFGKNSFGAPMLLAEVAAVRVIGGSEGFFCALSSRESLRILTVSL
tara:strand:- start:2043 stop:2267 length:225 start_codon:yes stop_codon:yes gene_type:complete